MALSGSRLCRETVKAALAFHGRRLWEEFEDSDVFALRVPGEPHLVFASILGALGPDQGLALFRGETAFQDILSALDSDDDEDDANEEASTIEFTMAPLWDIPPGFRGFLNRAGFVGRRETQAPSLISNEPGRPPREINATEARLLLYALRGILTAHETGCLDPMECVTGAPLLVLDLSGEPQAPTVSAHVIEPPDDVAEPDEDAPDAEIPAAGTETLPDPGDLKGWKAIELELLLRVTKRLRARTRPQAPASARYFGGRDVALDFIQSRSGRFALPAFVEWLLLDDRPAPGDPTLAEALLDGPLPAPQRALLQSRRASPPSFYRVVDLDPGTSLELEDVLTGNRVRVHDRALSETAVRDLLLPMRVIRAGSFHFPLLAGPPLSAMEFTDAVAFLEGEGLVFTPEGIAEQPHLLGRLWPWIEQRSARRGAPRLSNTDGEELVFQTAGFAVADVAALRQALRERPDVQPAGDEDTFAWFRPQEADARLPGDRLHLGRLELIGDELVVEVNSAERLQKARGWLEQVPGVRFLSKRTRGFQEAGEGPLDDRLNPPEPVPMTPELAGHLREFFRDYYRKWLDQPVPSLGGKTPRQACATERGQRDVALLIRSIPDPVGPPGAAVEVPREELLRELGLGP